MNTKRKKTGRKLLSFLLTLAMVMGLVPGISITAYAENSENAPTLGNSDLSGTGWSWNADTKTLTIGGVNWSGTLVMPADSTLVLTPETRNTITGSGTTEVYYGSSKIGNIYTGLYGKGALTISGSGELYVYSDSEKETSRSERQRGICVNGDLTINDGVGTVYAEAENSGFASGEPSNYCDIYSATVGISVHGNYSQYGGNVECVAGKGGYQSIGIAAGRGTAGITVDGANAVLTGRGGFASHHSFGMCCGSEGDSTPCSINIKNGKVNLYAADCGMYSYGLFGGNGCTLNVNGGEITAIGKTAEKGSIGLRSRGGINISGGVLCVEGLTSALYAGGEGVSGNISITNGMLVAKTGSETAVQVGSNGTITLADGLTTENVKSDFTSGLSNKIYVVDTNKPVRIGKLQYYVQFDVQNHGVSPATQYFDMDGNQKVSKPIDPVAAGYNFGGWFEEAGCTAEWDFAKTVSENTTIYAKWTEIPATAPTISAQPEDLSMTYGYTGGSICVKATAATDATYKDLTYQWYSNTTASNEGGTAITENGTSATYTIPTGKAVGTKEYYYCVVTATRVDNGQMATVTSNVASVTVSAAGNPLTYDGNGNTSGNVPTDTHSPYANGAIVTVLGNTGSLKKTGYTFVGWNTKADGTGTDYAEGATFAISANTTLYAKWNEVGKKGTDDADAVKKVTDAINKLPASASVTINDKNAIEAARKAYDALTADQKKKVPADVLKKLTDAENALKAAEAAEKAAIDLEAAKKEAQAAMNEQVTVTQKGNKLTVKWTKASSADGYYVYARYCGKKFTKPVKTIKKNSTTKTTITKIGGKKINQKKQLKVYVAPYKIIDGKKVKLAKSTVAHVVGAKNTKYSNVKKLTLTKNKYTVKVGKTAKIKAKVTLVNKNKKHIPKSHGAKFRYKSSDTSIATVDENGKIKGIKKGTCTIYVYSINGLTKKAQITVK